jgi:hypothetical protein
MADPDSTPTNGPTISLAEAADRCSASRSTIQRKLKAGEILGATRTDSGGWSIPITGLIGAGLMPRTTPADTAPAPVSDQSAEIELLRVKLAAAEDRATAAEAHRDDLRSIIEDYRRALAPGPVPPATSEVDHDPLMTFTTPTGSVVVDPKTSAPESEPLQRRKTLRGFMRRTGARSRS